MVREEILKKQEKFDAGEDIGSSSEEESFVEDDGLPLAERERLAKQEFLAAASGVGMLELGCKNASHVVDGDFTIEKRTKTEEQEQVEETEYEKFISARARKVCLSPHLVPR